ncbi:MAG TPA: hypothetical protein VKP65_16545, partial [Rhodothermales bacterium]|nr:hypothetical protein [Rhodothermales bacterium]
TSNVRSLPEMVEDGVNGYIIDVKDKDRDEVADEIVHHLETLIDDEEKRTAMGEASGAIARDKFDITVRNRHLAEIYDDALARS